VKLEEEVGYVVWVLVGDIFFPGDLDVDFLFFGLALLGDIFLFFPGEASF
jgi:hypothetical protein